MKTSSVLVTSLAAVVLLTAAAPAARAVVFGAEYWDAAHLNSAPGGGGTGLWDLNSANWVTQSGTDTTYVNASSISTNFGGTAGTVNLNAGNIMANDLFFQTAGYLVQDNPGTNYSLTVGYNGTVDNASGGMVTLTVPLIFVYPDNPAFLVSGTGGTFAISSNISAPYSLDANSVGGVGGGTIILSGSNTVGGITTVGSGTVELDGAPNTVANGVRHSGGPTTSQVLGGTSEVMIGGGTLLYGASDQIAAGTPMTLASGTFNLGTFSQDRAVALGALTVSTYNSAIDFGSGVSTGSVVAFANSSQIAWSAKLSIYDFRGTPLLGGGVDQLYFGTTANGLTAAQLSDITFYVGGPGSAELGTGIILSDGEVSYTPEIVPEPSAWVMMFSGVGLVGLTCHRRRARCNQAFAQGRAASTRDHFRAGDNRAVSEYNATTGVAISIVVRHEAKNHFGGKYVVPGSFPTLPHKEGIFPPGHQV